MRSTSPRTHGHCGRCLDRRGQWICSLARLVKRGTPSIELNLKSRPGPESLRLSNSREHVAVRDEQPGDSSSVPWHYY